MNSWQKNFMKVFFNLLKTITFCYRSSSQLSDERGGQSSKFGGKQSGKGVLFKKRRESELAGRTCEQGEDYLIEIEGSLLYFNLFMGYLLRGWENFKILNYVRQESSGKVNFDYYPLSL